MLFIRPLKFTQSVGGNLKKRTANMKSTRILIFIFNVILLNSCTMISEQYEEKGDELFNNEKYQEAIGYYIKALHYDMSDKELLHSIGRAYENLNDNDSAIYYYTAAIARDSNYALALRSRGFSYYSIGSYQSSLKDFLQSLSIEPNNKSAISNTGAVYQEIGDYENALKYYYKTIHLNPEHYGIMDELATIYFDLGIYDSCFYWAYKVIGNLDYGKDAPHGTLGLAYTAINYFDSAVHHLTKAIEYKPDFCHYYNNRGYALVPLGRYEEALEDYNISINLDTTNPNFFLNRADLFYRTAEYEKAILDYSTSITLSELYSGYNCGICFNNRAWAKRKSGDMKGYEMDKAKAKELGYPDNYKRFSNLESSYYGEK